MKNQTFGIEIETTGRYVGRRLGDWHIPMPDGRKWVVERDASVTDPCAEVVSPVCSYRGRPEGRLSRPNACDSDGCTLGDACVDEGESDIAMVQEVVRATRPVTDNPKYTFYRPSLPFRQRWLRSINTSVDCC